MSHDMRSASDFALQIRALCDARDPPLPQALPECTTEAPCPTTRGAARAAGFHGSSCQAIDGAEVPYDPPVVHRRAVPWPGDCIGVDLQRRVRRADLGPPQLRHAWELRHRRDPPTVRIAESRPLIGPELDRISVLVNITVVE